MITGQQIQQFRTSRGWSLHELGRLVGMHRLTLAQVEKGKVQLTPQQAEGIQAVMEGRNLQPPSPIGDGIAHDDEVELPNTLAALNPKIMRALTPEERLELASLMAPLKVVPATNEAIVAPPSLTLDSAAEMIADHVSAHDPTWADRLQIMRDERGLTILQAISTCISYVLEHSLQMAAVVYEPMAASPFQRGVQMACPHCGILYQPRYPGQPYCGNACADAHRAQASV